MWGLNQALTELAYKDSQLRPDTIIDVYLSDDEDKMFAIGKQTLYYGEKKVGWSHALQRISVIGDFAIILTDNGLWVYDIANEESRSYRFIKPDDFYPSFNYLVIKIGSEYYCIGSNEAGQCGGTLPEKANFPEHVNVCRGSESSVTYFCEFRRMPYTIPPTRQFSASKYKIFYITEDYKLYGVGMNIHYSISSKEENYKLIYTPRQMGEGRMTGVRICKVFETTYNPTYIEGCDNTLYRIGDSLVSRFKYDADDEVLSFTDNHFGEFEEFKYSKDIKLKHVIGRKYTNLFVQYTPPRCLHDVCYKDEDAILINDITEWNHTQVVIQADIKIIDTILFVNPQKHNPTALVYIRYGSLIIEGDCQLEYHISNTETYNALYDDKKIVLIEASDNGKIEGAFSSIQVTTGPYIGTNDCKSLSARFLNQDEKSISIEISITSRSCGISTTTIIIIVIVIIAPSVITLLLIMAYIKRRATITEDVEDGDVVHVEQTNVYNQTHVHTHIHHTTHVNQTVYNVKQNP